MTTVITPVAVGPDVEPDEIKTTPMTDPDHLATFGWAWDDPDKAETEASA